MRKWPQHFFLLDYLQHAKVDNAISRWWVVSVSNPLFTIRAESMSIIFLECEQRLQLRQSLVWLPLLSRSINSEKNNLLPVIKNKNLWRFDEKNASSAYLWNLWKVINWVRTSMKRKKTNNLVKTYNWVSVGRADADVVSITTTQRTEMRAIADLFILNASSSLLLFEILKILTSTINLTTYHWVRNCYWNTLMPVLNWISPPGQY